jgi:hypothetical protein
LSSYEFGRGGPPGEGGIFAEMAMPGAAALRLHMAVVSREKR